MAKLKAWPHRILPAAIGDRPKNAAEATCSMLLLSELEDTILMLEEVCDRREEITPADGKEKAAHSDMVADRNTAAYKNTRIFEVSPASSEREWLLSARYTRQSRYQISAERQLKRKSTDYRFFFSRTDQIFPLFSYQ
jgi:hypothetical protein